jgi:hypothetical protein
MICRDPAFWQPIIDHPLVKPHVSLGSDVDWLSVLLDSPMCVPFRGEAGGYFLVRMAHGTWDLHAAFEPRGWGRDANVTLKRALGAVEWDLIVSLEVDGNWRSRPPRSFGFRPAEPMRSGLRLYHLTRAAWEASPAFRRMETRCRQS